MSRSISLREMAAGLSGLTAGNQVISAIFNANATNEKADSGLLQTQMQIFKDTYETWLAMLDKTLGTINDNTVKILEQIGEMTSALLQASAQLNKI